MRNAAASFDDDYDYDAPARRTAPRKPRASVGAGKSKSRKKKGKRFAVDMHKVARISAVGMSATLAIGIMVNALMMQKGHHPAPLFGKGALGVSTIVAPAPAKTARVTVPDPAPQVEEAAPLVAPAPMPAIKPRHAAATDQASTKAPGDDQIARLLKTGVVPVAAADKSDGKMVLGAQKALAKLGFTLKPNGTMGPGWHSPRAAWPAPRHEEGDRSVREGTQHAGDRRTVPSRGQNPQRRKRREDRLNAEGRTLADPAFLAKETTGTAALDPSKR